MAEAFYQLSVNLTKFKPCALLDAFYEHEYAPSDLLTSVHTKSEKQKNRQASKISINR